MGNSLFSEVLAIRPDLKNSPSGRSFVAFAPRSRPIRTASINQVSVVTTSQLLSKEVRWR